MSEQQQIHGEFLRQLVADGLTSPRATLVPLAGGVSSDIYLVSDVESGGGHTPQRRFVVKRALARLRVKDDWRADVGRNISEQNFIRYVSAFLPDAMPRLIAGSQQHAYFAMEWLDDQRFANWKTLLMHGRIDPRHAAMAGSILGTIHARSAGDPHAERTFATDRNFHELRIEPYLLTTARRHPDLQPVIDAEAQRLGQTHEALVHGDFSPKNMLIGGPRMVLLDCEVAWYGDPAFDGAFLVTHLCLKALYHGRHLDELRQSIDRFMSSYATSRDDDAAIQQFQHRLARLVPMLLLARLDGKSPVEYLTDENQRQWLRDLARELIARPVGAFDDVVQRYFTRLCDTGLRR
ncbi:phosphotransferase family protein [Fontivita pretiosa]|uniref:phosphotransferase family protein n=1 Tax=Fontivita pretiosa TaxID=2989684 RepID=UPI003D163727